MANINFNKFVADLRNELLNEIRETNGDMDVTEVASAFNYAALTVTTRLLGDSDPQQISLPLTKKEGPTRGEKAWRTRKKNAAKKANRENSIPMVGRSPVDDAGEDEGDNLEA